MSDDTLAKQFHDICLDRYKRGEVSYKMVVNSFAVMDEDNRRMFLGLGKDSVNRRPGQSLGQADASLFNATDGRKNL